MDGRVKTLHPKIHGGILARRGIDDAVLAAQSIDLIDLVVVNLYPFAATIARQDCTDAMAIENIDIGGPTMVRAAAKNHADVLVVVSPNDYSEVLHALSENKKVKFSRGCHKQKQTTKIKKKLQQPLNRHTKKNDNSEPERKPRPAARPPTAADRAHTGAPPETRQNTSPESQAKAQRDPHDHKETPEEAQSLQKRDLEKTTFGDPGHFLDQF